MMACAGEDRWGINPSLALTKAGQVLTQTSIPGVSRKKAIMTTASQHSCWLLKIVGAELVAQEFGLDHNLISEILSCFSLMLISQCHHQNAAYPLLLSVYLTLPISLLYGGGFFYIFFFSYVFMKCYI